MADFTQTVGLAAWYDQRFFVHEEEDVVIATGAAENKKF
jgi:hypothetical protein